MRFHTEGIPYSKLEGKNIDFEKKRLEFWLETVPSDIRRLKFDLLVRYRKLFHANFYRHNNREKHGRFTFMPEFTEDIDKNIWETYKENRRY